MMNRRKRDQFKPLNFALPRISPSPSPSPSPSSPPHSPSLSTLPPPDSRFLHFARQLSSSSPPPSSPNESTLLLLPDYRAISPQLEEKISCNVEHDEPQGECAYLSFSPAQDDTRLLVEKAAEGLIIHPPELVAEGTGGTYFLKGPDGDIVAVFKPWDEEVGAENNPKKTLEPFTNNPSCTMTSSEKGFGEGLVPGEGALKECAAWILDIDRFAQVPSTCLVCLSHPSFPYPKVGSFQAYVQHDIQSWDVGCKVFPVLDVQKIAQLDVRLCNADRHGGNILLSSASLEQKALGSALYSLTPIDHGLCLPSFPDFGAELWFEWMSFPQSQEPLLSEVKSYVKSLDPEKDAKSLRNMGMSEESISTMLVCTTLLKEAAKQNMSFYKIGSIMIRMKDPDEPSILENICSQVIKDVGYCDLVYVKALIQKELELLV